MKRLISLVLCLLFGGMAVVGWAEEPKVTIKVEPQNSFVAGDQRSYRRVIVYIPRHEENRNIRLEWDSVSGEAGATERQLSGSNSPYIIEGASLFGKTGGLMLPVGEYVVRAILTRGGKKFSATVETNVILAGEGF